MLPLLREKKENERCFAEEGHKITLIHASKDIYGFGIYS
jgi:hypothetical protein